MQKGSVESTVLILHEDVSPLLNQPTERRKGGREGGSAANSHQTSATKGRALFSFMSEAFQKN